MRRFHRCSCQSISNSPLDELKGGWRKITSGPCLNSLFSYWRSDVTFRRLRCFARSKIIMAVNDRYCVFTIFGMEDELWKLGQRLITKHVIRKIMSFLGQLCRLKNLSSSIRTGIQIVRSQYLFSSLCGILNWALASLLVLLKRTLGFNHLLWS